MNKYFSAIALFVIIVLIISIGLNLYQTQKFDELLNKSQKVYLCTVNQEDAAVFTTLKDGYTAADSVGYFELVTQKTNQINFDFGSINEPEGFELQAIGSNSDSTLIRVYIYRDSPTLAKSRQEIFWIWRSYLSREKCN